MNNSQDRTKIKNMHDDEGTFENMEVQMFCTAENCSLGLNLLNLHSIHRNIGLKWLLYVFKRKVFNRSSHSSILVCSNTGSQRYDL